MKNGLSRFAVLSAGVVAACSSAGTDAERADASTSADRVSVAASADTRSAIGVSSWGIRSGADGSTVVRGYDVDRTKLVAFEYRTAHTAGTTTFAAAVGVGTRSPTLRIVVPDGGAARAIESGIAGDAESKTVLAHMVADLRTGKAMPSTTSTRMLGFASDAPAQLVDTGPQQLIECNQALTEASADAGQTTADCGADPGSPACSQGVAKAPGDQEKANECKNESCTDSPPPSGNGRATRKGPLTGAGTSSLRWHVDGTDLGIPFSLGKGSTGFLFGDSFDAPGVGGAGWRSPVLLRSSSKPSDGIEFAGSGYAPQSVDSPHTGCNGEFTVIPNDGVLLPDGRTVVSFMSVRNWKGICPEQYPGQWRTGHAGLAWATTGDHFTRAPIRFGNDDGNQDPYQMQTMQLDGEYVYVYSVRAGRQSGPMMLQRVVAKDILNRDAYECLGDNGAWGKSCKSILPETDFGEPSVRKLDDCVWAMAYLAGGKIVTRTASKPEGPWSDEHVQLTFGDKPCLYGGFIHPESKANELHLMVSAWGDAAGCGTGSVYGVDHFVGAL